MAVQLLPYQTLSAREMLALADFRCRYGMLAWTREQAGSTHRRVLYAALPLVETVDRRVVSCLHFWRRWAALRGIGGRDDG